MAAVDNTDVQCTDRPSKFKVDICTEIGGRPRQEDRFFVRQDINVAGTEVGFFGVWDGTVDPHASDFVHTRCCGHHLNSAGFQEYCSLLENNGSSSEIANALIRATEEGYAATDKEVIQSCHELRNHYSSCTSVTCIVASGLLTVGHLGDSRLYLLEHAGEQGQYRGSCLTDDHKPDDPEERMRIERSGGTIQHLTHHHNKPFIRGGDFDRRKASGERVMQLQYSRAFGGKDLKPFGLSSTPTVTQVQLNPKQHAGFVLCSDGVSDVCTAENCAIIVGAARERGEDAAVTLVRWAIKERARVGIGADNVTAVVVWFNPE